MYLEQLDTQYVLRCAQCNKPFDKESTLKRHGYYCRSRNSTVAAPRARSCFACAKAKARCDAKRSGCSRCVGKAISCHYPSSRRSKNIETRGRNGSGDTFNSWNEASSRTSGSLSDQSPEGFTNSLDATFDGDSFDFDLDNMVAGIVEWDDPTLDFTEMLDPQKNFEIAALPFTQPSFANLHPPFLKDHTKHTQQSLSSRISIPLQPAMNVRSLVDRPRITTARQRVAHLMLHTLKSYPLMMLRHQDLPPFIHPHTVSSSSTRSDMESLNNCISLVQMIGAENQNNRKLFWRNVRVECERIQDDTAHETKWKLLAAMQVLVIYILIRIDEGETDHNNLDFLLLSTVTVVANRFNNFYAEQSTEVSPRKCDDAKGHWEDWILDETIKRLCVVYQSVNMLVYFEPAAMCNLQKELVLAPLPSKKQLWESVDESSWETANKKQPLFRTAFGLAANGDLVKFDGQPESGDTMAFHGSRLTSWSVAPWEEWCAGMDGFGGLVMLAASLVSG